MTLARALLHPLHEDQPLFPSGYILTTADIAQLHELGIYDLWVNHPDLDFLDDLFTPQLTTVQLRLCEALKNAFHQHAQRAHAIAPPAQYQSLFTELVQTVLDAATRIQLLSQLADDESLLRHCAEVSVLSICLGLRLENYLVEQRKRPTTTNTQRTKDLLNLATGAMFHDIGELQLTEKDRESRRPSPLAEELSSDWRKHADLGFSAVRSFIEPSAATIILNHHQHFDGSGFPAIASSEFPQCGSQIHVFSRIAMAADTFQHLLHQDGLTRPTVCALWQIQQNPIRRWFDPVVLATLLAAVPPFTLGMVVTLSDRRHAIITRLHDDAPCYPEVQILESENLLPEPCNHLPEQIDLATTPNLYIESLDGYHIAEFLYGPRHTAALQSA
jgi:HD-GYP domain-containing protein (c-di-GMP phosphodiesterase class II)